MYSLTYYDTKWPLTSPKHLWPFTQYEVSTTHYVWSLKVNILEKCLQAVSHTHAYTPTYITMAQIPLPTAQITNENSTIVKCIKASVVPVLSFCLSDVVLKVSFLWFLLWVLLLMLLCLFSKLICNFLVFLLLLVFILFHFHVCFNSVQHLLITSLYRSHFTNLLIITILHAAIESFLYD